MECITCVLEAETRDRNRRHKRQTQETETRDKNKRGREERVEYRKEKTREKMTRWYIRQGSNDLRINPGNFPEHNAFFTQSH